ncbi:MAG: ribose-5-phosphate isomerase [Propionibacterium sp.]|nr:ribose-5-phosphate isomerase [Propionibacterium sp.]
MRVHIGTDHAAFELKEFLVTELTALGYEIIDHGAHNFEPLDDYPTTIIPCAEAVAASDGELGIVLGGSGNGEQIAANKVVGIRAALAYSRDTARLAREHNNANVISLGGRMQSQALALEYVRVFLETPFSGAERHARRIAMLDHYERTGRLD